MHLIENRFVDEYFPELSCCVDFQEMTLQTWKGDEVRSKVGFRELDLLGEWYMKGLERRFEAEYFGDVDQNV